MLKKKILSIGPVSAQSADNNLIANSLSFLDKHYDIDYLDSLSIMEDVPNTEYYQLWKEKLAPYVTIYDAFFGFSFGGIIIQQCFTLFNQVHKPIILFSTPTFADPELREKLTRVLSLCQEDKLIEALTALYQPVFYPNEMPELSIDMSNKTQACQRLNFGLTRVLNTDSTEILKKNTVQHLHLIGEYSHLVNRANVLKAKNGRLIIVPKASMRMLHDQLPFCQKVILEALTHEAF